MTLSEFTTSSGVWKGWHWRYVSVTVLVVGLLQAIANLTFNYDLVSSLPIAVLSVSYLVILKVKERRLANAMAAVIATFILGVILQVSLQHYGYTWHGQKFLYWVQSDAWTLAIGVVMAYAYLRLTQWSERKRGELDAKRAAKSQQPSTTQPVRRHHKKRKKRRR
jgi:hypothetical protein